jgi:hypothetical protein
MRMKGLEPSRLSALEPKSSGILAIIRLLRLYSSFYTQFKPVTQMSGYFDICLFVDRRAGKL